MYCSDHTLQQVGIDKGIISHPQRHQVFCARHISPRKFSYLISKLEKCPVSTGFVCNAHRLQEIIGNSIEFVGKICEEQTEIMFYVGLILFDLIRIFNKSEKCDIY